MMTPQDKFISERKTAINAQANDADFQRLSREWLNASIGRKYSYHFDWLGRPIIQYPQDIVAVQELIWQVKPDLVIETGIAHGGSLILSASILALLEYAEAAEKGELLDPANPRRLVLGLDIDIRAHNRTAIEAHPLAGRIKMLQGSSIDPEIVQQVKSFAAPFRKIMVFLDSNHTHDHVLGELRAYADLVSPDSYCVVFDTVIEHMPKGYYRDRPWDVGNSPKTAVDEYLRELEAAQSPVRFEIDKEISNKLGISVAPGGFLRRVQ